MMTLVTGGCKCGKSHYAEKVLDSFGGRKIYIATMQPFGQEAHEAIERHRKMRQGKGFETIEKYTDLDEIEISENSAVLLECTANLCANEMFSSEEPCYPAERIINAFRKLNAQAEKLVVVTNSVGSDGVVYPRETMEYIRCMGEINSRLADMSDNVIECVYGIPVLLKGELL